MKSFLIPTLIASVLAVSGAQATDTKDFSSRDQVAGFRLDTNGQCDGEWHTVLGSGPAHSSDNFGTVDQNYVVTGLLPGQSRTMSRDFGHILSKDHPVKVTDFALQIRGLPYAGTQNFSVVDVTEFEYRVGHPERARLKLTFFGTLKTACQKDAACRRRRRN